MYSFNYNHNPPAASPPSPRTISILNAGFILPCKYLQVFVINMIQCITLFQNKILSFCINPLPLPSFIQNYLSTLCWLDFSIVEKIHFQGFSLLFHRLQPIHFSYHSSPLCPRGFFNPHSYWSPSRLFLFCCCCYKNYLNECFYPWIFLLYYACVLLSCFSHIWLFATLWTARLLCPWDSSGKDAGVDAMPSSRESSDAGVKPTSLMSLVLAGRFFTTSDNLGSPISYICLTF